jgi:hypothetical protein
MSKYQPLQAYLSRQKGDEIPMTFKEIEGLVGPLPPSSRYRAWWSNNEFNSVMTRAWLDAGFKTERVNMDSGKLVFRRVAPETPTETQSDRFASLYGGLRGTITINFDLTAPTGERWASASE